MEQVYTSGAIQRTQTNWTLLRYLDPSYVTPHL